jgi:adenylate cyclase
MTRADVAEARRLFARAIELDPDYAEAIAYLGTTYTFEYAMGWNRDPELITRAHALAERALTLDPRVPVAHALEANVRVFEQRPAQAIASAERAVELAPSLDPPHFILGMTLVFAGRPVAALEHVKTALRINPRGPPTYRTLLGLLNLLAGRVDEAVRLCEEVRAENADMLHARILLAVVYAEERPQEARRVVREILRVNPELTAATAVGLYPGRLAQSRREAWKRALRAAGMP